MKTEEPISYFSDIEKDMRKFETRLASGGKRFTNLIIDTVFFYALMVIGMVVLIVFFGVNIENSEWTLNIAVIASYILYFTYFEAASGKTLGKFFTKTHVVKEDGEKMDFKTALLRSLCRLIPFDHFSFLGGKTSVGWHDTISKTRVVNDEM